MEKNIFYKISFSLLLNFIFSSFILFISQESHAQYFNVGAFWKNPSDPIPEGQWDQRQFLPPTMSGSKATWTGTEMIVWGGQINGSYTSKGFRYNPTTNTWTAISELNAPTPRSGHTIVYGSGIAIVWGGAAAASTNPIKTGGKYDVATDTWTATSIGTNCPTGRYQHTAVWDGNEMIVWGGWTGAVALTGAKYTPGTDTWVATFQGAGVPAGRYGHSAIWTGTEMIIWGGMGSSAALKTGNKYTPGATASAGTWSSTVNDVTTPAIRMHHSAVWTGTEMIVWGGHNNDTSAPLNTGGKYTPGTNTWTATGTGTDVASARTGHTAVWDGTQMIIWGGWNGTTVVNTGSYYVPGTDTWTAMTTTNAPEARQNQVGLWTGTEMIVFGGIGATDIFSSGGKYTVAGGWSSTATPAPNPNIYMRAVWTGSELLVYGSGTYSKVGYKFDPSSDTWAAMTTTDAPPGTRNATAVWTGTEMIVWGGAESAVTLVSNNGAKYDPVANDWDPLSTGAGVPSARASASSIWTGTEMIVWGGTDGAGTTVYNTGSRYDPVGDSWTATGGTPPAGRFRHTAIWTGTEMIVWGGWDGSNELDSGGRYNPVGNSWTATDTSDVDSPGNRMRHSAVWTGNEMIIWGGVDGVIEYDTGHIYNPSNNTWRQARATDAPAARYYHTAVWTGTEMIIFGGTEGTTSLATGGRYDLLKDSWVTLPITDPEAPNARMQHLGLWTGTEMLIYGGTNFSGVARDNSVYLYDPSTLLPDAIDCWDGPVSNLYIGKACTELPSVIFAGTFQGNKYVIMPSGCDGTTSNPTCTGSIDGVAIEKIWRGTGGASTNTNAENVAADADMSVMLGDANQTAIITAATTTADSAVQYCDNMTYGGFTNWYLPSKSELTFIYCHSTPSGTHVSTNPLEDPDCLSYGGKTSQITGFNDYYWSSSENSAGTSAYYQRFGTGAQTSAIKSGSRGVRCIRRVSDAEL